MRIGWLEFYWIARIVLADLDGHFMFQPFDVGNDDNVGFTLFVLGGEGAPVYSDGIGGEGKQVFHGVWRSFRGCNFRLLMLVFSPAVC